MGYRTLELELDDLATFDAAAHELREYANELRASARRRHADNVEELTAHLFAILGRAAVPN